MIVPMTTTLTRPTTTHARAARERLETALAGGHLANAAARELLAALDAAGVVQVARAAVEAYLDARAEHRQAATVARDASRDLALACRSCDTCRELPAEALRWCVPESALPLDDEDDPELDYAVEALEGCDCDRARDALTDAELAAEDAAEALAEAERVLTAEERGRWAVAPGSSW